MWCGVGNEMQYGGASEKFKTRDVMPVNGAGKTVEA